MKTISILGSTGSIGTQSLDVARWRNYDVVALAAGRNIELLLEQIREFQPKYVACEDCQLAKLKDLLYDNGSVEIVTVNELAEVEVDTVVAAIPGIAGLEPTIKSLTKGRHVALANKEAMVVAGPLVWEVARANNATLTPLDSEHSALFQCLVGEPEDAISKLILTASGGPFRTEPADLSGVKPEQALKHPNWSMGSKVTIDSATLFNKGLEVLEAHFLFEFQLEDIDVVVHPQSLIHGLVRYTDGSIKAQIGPHDMRYPIQYGIEYPERPNIPLEPLPILGEWTFFEPDLERFPSLKLAYEAGRLAGTAPTALNAADEIAVEAFLGGKIPFTAIPEVLEGVLEQVPTQALTWESIALVNKEARDYAENLCSNYS